MMWEQLEKTSSEGDQGAPAQEFTFEINPKHEVQSTVPSAGHDLFLCIRTGAWLFLRINFEAVILRLFFYYEKV